MTKILDITFWVGFLSVLVHFNVWLLIKDSGDIEFINKTRDLLFLSGGLAMLAYFFMPSNVVNDNGDNNG